MANDDFIKRDDMSGVGGGKAIVMPSPQPSSTTSFLSTFVQGIMNSKGAEEKMKKEKDKLSYYSELREAGYSAEEASSRVNKQFSGSFLDKTLGRNSAGFQTPTGADPYTAKAEKEKAELEEKKASTKEKLSKGEYYRKGGARGTTSGEAPSVIKERMARLDKQIKKLEETSAKAKKNDPDSGARQEKLQAYRKAYDKLLLASGESDGEESSGSDGYVPGVTKVDDEFTGPDGKRYVVKDITDPDDPEVEEV